MRSSFEMEPLFGLSKAETNACHGVFETCRKQLLYINRWLDPNQENISNTNPPIYYQFPLISGYALGMMEAYLIVQRSTHLATQPLSLIIHIHNSFNINRMPIAVAEHAESQQPSFHFGLHLGYSDASTAIVAGTEGAAHPTLALAHTLQTLLQYTDETSLLTNLHLLRTRLAPTSGVDLRDVARSWLGLWDF